MIHATELSDQPFGKVEEIVKEDEKITAKVIKLDPEKKKISLSIKDYIVEKNQINHDDIVVGNFDESSDKDSSDKDEN